MNKQLLLTMLLAMTILLSVSAISASEVNVTDSYTTNLVDDTSDVSVLTETTTDSSVLSVSSDSNVDNDSSKVSLSSEEVLESENSNTLSTNLDVNNVSSDSEGATHFAAYSDDAKVSASTIDVSKTITSKDLTKYFKGSSQYSATFYDNNGNVLKNTNVKVTVNGVTYTIKTDAKGVASLEINLKPKTYTITAVNPKTGYSLSNTIKVLSTIKSSDLSKIYTDSKKFTATFLDSNGKPLANKNIKFKINGITYTQKTNSNGVASLAINLKKGTYEMTSTNVDGLAQKNTVKVLTYTTTKLTASDYTFLPSDTKTIKVTLIHGLGYAPGEGKTIKFTVNGKTYTATTNSKGEASIKLPNLSVGTYTVKYSFAGNIYYGASSTSSKVSIIASKTPTFTVKSSSTFGNGANTPFKVALTSGGTPLVGKTVTITVNGVSYDRTTDSNGIASLPIGLKVGKYTVSYKNKADSEINSITGSTKITVVERAATKVTWKSGTSFDEGSQTYKVLLQDSNGNALANKTVQLKVNSNTYSAVTSSTGYASFKVNVPAGNYTVSFSYPANGDNDYAPSSASKKITVLKKDTVATGNGYWLFGGDMKNADLSKLASQGTTDIFLNYYAFTAHGQSAVESWIASANKLGIRVHIWMQTFYSSGWVNPVKNGAANSDLFDEKIAEAIKYASVKGVAGVHFDYLRYPGTAYKTAGGTEAISSFVKQVTEALHKINPNIIVSCALMPETTNNVYYYGQDYSVISKYMDVVVPMIYKGNYKSSSSWITSTTKWFVDNSKGAKVWAGIQGYESDDNVVKLSSSEIKKDAQAAVSGKAAGVVIFRWGVTNFVDFNSLTTGSSSTSGSSSSSTSGGISISDIVTAANNLKSTIASTGSVPTSISVAGSSYSTSQFLYMMTKAVEYIHDGKTSTKITPVKSNAPSNPSSTAKKGDLSLSAYLDLASRVSTFIVNNGQSPNYANSDLGHIQYSSLVDAFSRVLAYYKTNSKLPNSVTVYPKVSASNAVSASPSEDTAAKTISIKNIVSGATTLKTYYANNNKLPDSVTAGGVKFTVPEFLYLMSQAIYQLGNSNTKDIEYITGVSAASSPSGDAIDAELYKKDYLTVSKSVADDIKANKKAPNYVSTSLGKINYNALVDAFSRVVAFYGSNNNALPNYVTIHAKAISSSSSTNTGTTTTGKTISIKDIITGSTTLKTYYANNNKLPDSVTAGGVKFTVPEFLYLMSQAIYQLGNSNTNAIAYITGVSAASSPSGDVINANLEKVDYLNVSKNVANYIKTNKNAPNYASSSLGKINYNELVDAFSRVVAYYGANNQMPNYVTIRSPGSDSSTIVGATGSGLNEKCTITDLEPYLKSSKNCQVNNSAIKTIVDSLTEGLTSDYDKAQAIFNYVRDKISYSFYYDTKYGAVGTLNAKTGNCVDQSHLLVAMYRTAGLASRYVHGADCHFSSGTYGHVWTQVLVDGNWIVSDATSARNSFGKIVNWNTNSFTLKGIYSGISF